MNCIATVAAGPVERLAALTLPGLRSYAKHCGAELVIIDRLFHGMHPSFSKMYLYDVVRQYDRVAYFDLDVLIRRTAPNIFDSFPERNAFVAYDEREVWKKAGRDAIDHTMKTLGVLCDVYFNAGVMIPPSGASEIFLPEGIVPVDIYNDQTWLNARLKQSAHPFLDAGRRWNSLGVFRPEGVVDEGINVIHYAGLVGCHRCRLIAADLALYGDNFFRGGR